MCNRDRLKKRVGVWWFGVRRCSTASIYADHLIERFEPLVGVLCKRHVCTNDKAGCPTNGLSVGHSSRHPKRTGHSILSWGKTELSPSECFMHRSRPQVNLEAIHDGMLRLSVVDGGQQADIQTITVRIEPHVQNSGDDRALSAYLAIKRAVDIVGASVLLVVLSPLFALVALAIFFEDGAPVLFTQDRAGKGGRPFRLFKFRTMRRDAEQRKAALLAQNESADGVIFKMRDDPRVLRIGRFLRRMSIDELPQLLNVLNGTMSLVGPRPHPVNEAAAYNEEARFRLTVTPGITCLWQVMGRSAIPFGEQVKMDRFYIEHRSLWLDVKILYRTVWAVLSGRGAY